MSAHSSFTVGKRSRVLVTGGAGFIGSHLCDLLTDIGATVRIVDDLRYGISHLSDRWASKYSIHNITIGDPDHKQRLSTLLGDSDVVFHLASPVGVRFVHENPQATFNSIISAGRTLVDLCERHRKPIVFSSSSEVYGNSSGGHLDEKAPLVSDKAPRFSYAAGKIEVERMISKRLRNASIDAWIVRLFNVAGPRQRPDAGVFAAFSQAAAQRSMLKIHGNGTQVRSFLHVSDTTNALLKVVESPQLRWTPVNIGSQTPTKISELAARFCELAPGAYIEHQTYADAFGSNFSPIFTRTPCTRLLRETCLWHPSHSLDDIIGDCIAYASTLGAETNAHR